MFTSRVRVYISSGRRSGDSNLTFDHLRNPLRTKPLRTLEMFSCVKRRTFQTSATTSSSTIAQEAASLQGSASPCGGPGGSVSRRPLLPLERRGTACPRTICVTGAAGYLGSRVVYRLLLQGHTVHAVDLPGAVRHQDVGSMFDDLAASAPGRLHIFKGDITKGDGGADDSTSSPDATALTTALAGCDAVVHLAAVVQLVPPPAVQKKMLHVAMEGTANVMAAVGRPPARRTLRRVVMLSSVAACAGDNWERGSGHCITESDFAQVCSMGHNTYSYVKRESELLARKICREQQQQQSLEQASSSSETSESPKPWSLVTICPGVTFGPVELARHALTSPGMLLGLLKLREVFRWFGSRCSGAGLFLVPDLHTLYSDVDDVAAAICATAVATDEELGGVDRFLVGSAVTSIPAIAAHLESLAALPKQGTSSPLLLAKEKKKRTFFTPPRVQGLAGTQATNDSNAGTSSRSNNPAFGVDGVDAVVHVTAAASGKGSSTGGKERREGEAAADGQQNPATPFAHLPNWITSRVLPALMRVLIRGMDTGVLLGTMGKPLAGVDMSQAARVLGLDQTVPWEATLRDGARSMGDLGLIKDWPSELELESV